MNIANRLLCTVNPVKQYTNAPITYALTLFLLFNAETNAIKAAPPLIKDVSRVKGADKLLKFRLDAGDEGERQILSGIAQWYPEPEKLIGKKVIAVTNLQPRKMRGEISQGMLLSAEFGDTVQLITVPDEIPAGSLVG